MSIKIIKGTDRSLVIRFGQPNGDPEDLSGYEEIRFCLVKSDLTDLFIKRIAITGDTHSNTIIDNTDTTDLAVGDAIVGAGIPANTTIATIVNSTSLTLSQAATATASGVSLVVGSLIILDAVLGKVQLDLSAADTDDLPDGINNLEVKLIKSGVVSYQQLPGILNLIPRYC